MTIDEYLKAAAKLSKGVKDLQAAGYAFRMNDVKYDREELAAAQNELRNGQCSLMRDFIAAVDNNGIENIQNELFMRVVREILK